MHKKTESTNQAENDPSGMSSSPSVRAFRLLVFFALFVAMAVAFDATLNTGLRKIHTSGFGVSNAIFSGRVDASILITGSSRALTHYDSRVIQNVTGHSTFNIGINGSQTDMQVALFRAYLLHNKKPRLVIHNLDLYSFQTTHEIYDPAQYLPYLGEEPLYNAIRRIYPDAWKWKYLPLYGYATQDMRFDWMLGLMSFIGHQPAEDHYLGFLPRHTPWTGDFDKFKEDHPHGIKTDIEQLGVYDLTDLVQICREQGIAVLFVYSPEYYEMQNMELDRSAVFSKFRDICSHHGVPMWDYSDSILCKSRSNFYNSQHLNADGAEAFTTALANRLVASGMITPAEHSIDRR